MFGLSYRERLENKQKEKLEDGKPEALLIGTIKAGQTRGRIELRLCRVLLDNAASGAGSLGRFQKRDVLNAWF